MINEPKVDVAFKSTPLAVKNEPKFKIHKIGNFLNEKPNNEKLSSF